MEDPLTGDFPSRNILAEEDEFAISRNLKSLYSVEPLLSLEDGVSLETSVSKKLLLLVGKAASCLNSFLLGEGRDGTRVGSISMPCLPKTAVELVGDDEKKHVATVSTTGGRDVVICMEKAVDQEQALSWSTFVFDQLQPKAIVIVGSLDAYMFRGCFDGARDEMVYKVTTAGYHSNAADIPLLPTGNLLHGVEAAMVNMADLHGLPAVCLVGISTNQCPTYGLVSKLASAALQEMAFEALRVDEKKHLQQILQQRYISSADISVYV